MKSFFVLALALVSANAFAASQGEAELVVDSDQFGQNVIDVIDTGTGLESVTDAGTLAKTATGYKGFYLNEKYWDYSCTATACTGNGPTSLDLTATAVAGGYKLDGTVNFEPASITVTATKIEVSVGGVQNVSFELTQAGSAWTGSGTQTVGDAIDTLDDVTFTTSGSLANAAQDPATAVALLVLPFARAH